MCVFRRENAVLPYHVAVDFLLFFGMAELFRFNNRFSRERRPRRSMGFNAFSRTTARAVRAILFFIFVADDAHIVTMQK